MTKSEVTEELKNFLVETIKTYSFQEASTEDLNSKVEGKNIKGLDKTDPQSWQNTVRHALISLRRKKVIHSFAKNLNHLTSEEERKISDWISQNRPGQTRIQQIWYLKEDCNRVRSDKVVVYQADLSSDGKSEFSDHIKNPAEQSYSDFPDEINPDSYYEGASRKIFVNAYERDPKARQKCLDYHGLSCKICGFNFEERFGILGRGFIHVHHLKPLSEIGEEYKVDPLKDLLPVCPNCHAIFHRREPALSVEEVKAARKISSLSPGFTPEAI